MRKNIRFGVSLLLVAVMVLTGLCACGKPSEEKTEEQESISLYFGNEAGTDLVEEKLSVKDMEADAMPRFALQKLLDGPQNPKNSRVIRAGTALLEMQSEKGVITVNLSKEFYHEDSILDVLASASIVKTLCSIRGVGNVKILIEGTELTFDDGSVSGEIKESDLVFDADALGSGEENVTLYFCDSEAESLVREIRRINVPKGESMEKLIVAELIRGPQKEKTYKTVPAETKIRSVETKDGVCFVNLSGEFISRHSGGTTAEYLTIYSVVNSLTELSNVERVQFLIEGEKKDVFIHMMLNEPLERDVSMVRNS